MPASLTGNLRKISKQAITVNLIAVLVAMKNKSPETHMSDLLHPSTGTFEVLCKDAGAEAWMLEQLKVAGKGDKLKGFEAIKKLVLEPEMFSIENDLLTPTFKYKRPQLQKRYQKDIDAMYKGLNE